MQAFIKNRFNSVVFCFWFFIINIPIFWLAGLRYFLGELLPSGWVAGLYGWLTYLSHLAFFALLANLLCVIFAIIWPKRLFVAITATIVNTIAVIAIIADATVFKLYHLHIDWRLFSLIFSQEGRSVLDLETSDWMILVIGLAIVLFIQMGIGFLISKKRHILKLTKKWITYELIALLFCGIIGHAMYAVAWAGSYTPILEASSHMPLYMHTSANGFIRKLHIMRVKRIQNYIISEHAMYYPKHPLKTQQTNSKLPNIMMILIDTWRHDMLNIITSPNIYNFSHHALIFDNHFSGGNQTQAGLFSLFYSMPSSYWTLAINNHISPLFINLLKKNNYKLAIYASAPLNTPFQFDKTIFQNIKNLQIITPGNSPVQKDQKITQEMLNFLRNPKTHRHPFFGFLFYDAVHAYSFPKNFPAKFKPYKNFPHAELTNNTNITAYKNLYMNAVVFDDSLVNKILQELKHDGYLKNTIIIISADHGEAFNDFHQDIWGHGYSFAPPVTHIPFILYWPQYKPAVIKYRTTHYDVVPTLFKKVFHVTNPTLDYGIGHSLFKNRKQDYIFADSDRHKFGIIGKNHITVINRTGFSYDTDMQFKKLPKEVDLKAIKYTNKILRHFSRI